MSQPPDLEQRVQALALEHHALVMAPAGSGKTGLLVQRMLRALAVVEQPEQVIAITFTRKAAAEIRGRILDALQDAQAGLPSATAHEAAMREAALAVLARDQQQGWQLQAQSWRLCALTIDAYCAQLAAQAPVLSGLGGSLGTSDDAWPMYERAILRLFEELEDASLMPADRQALSRILRLYGNRFDRLMEPLSALLARRDQWLLDSAQTDPQAWAQQDAQVLQSLLSSACERFSRSLDADQKTRLIACVRAGSAQSEVLAWAAELEDWPSDRAALLQQLCGLLLTVKGEIRKKVDKRQGFVAKADYTRQFQALLGELGGDDTLRQAAVELMHIPLPPLPAEVQDLRLAWLRVLRRLVAHLRVVFAEQQQTDFPELALAALQAVRPGPEEVGEALLRSDARLRHLLVDEMQDTSAVQLRLIEALTAEWRVGDGRSLFLVGDPQQSIYAFRNAQVRLFLDLWHRGQLGALALKRLRLSANFRSEPAVVDWFNKAFSTVFDTRPDVARGAVAFSASQAMRARGADSGVRVMAFHQQADEAQTIAAQAAELARSEQSVAVLARSRSRLEPIVRALRARGLTPSCQDLDPLAALPEVRDVIALARALWHPQDHLSWAVLLRAPFVGLSWKQMVDLSLGRQQLDWRQRIEQALGETDRLDQDARQRLSRLMQALRASESDAQLCAVLADQCEAVWRALDGPLACSLAALEDVEQALLCLREETRGGSIRDLGGLQRRLARLYAAPRAGQVQLMTVHKAKGLEFDHVFIAAANAKSRSGDRPAIELLELAQGRLLLPKPDEAWSRDHPAVASYEFVHDLSKAAANNEVRRLLYVAVTRARCSAAISLVTSLDDASEPQFESGSFAHALASLIKAPVIQALQTAPEPKIAMPGEQPPSAPRLPLGATLPRDEGLYRPRQTRLFRPSESVLLVQEEPEPRRDEGDLYAQLVGTLYHEAMQRISEEGMTRWADAGRSRRAAMAAGLRRRAMPEPLVMPAVDRVLQLLERTLARDTGRWLVSPKPWARSEYALSAFADGRWTSAVIDRCFEDEAGQLWVIDYKTAAYPVAPDQRATYLENGTQKYRQQLLVYRNLMLRLRPHAQVTAAIYFAECDRLIRIAE